MKPSGKTWVLTDGTTGIATAIARDPRNIYRLDHRVIRARMQRGLLSPEDVFAPRRYEHIRQRDAVSYVVGPPPGAVEPVKDPEPQNTAKPFDNRKPAHTLITPPETR